MKGLVTLTSLGLPRAARIGLSVLGAGIEAGICFTTSFGFSSLIRNRRLGRRFRTG
jgi:hypothetical protein